MTSGHSTDGIRIEVEDQPVRLFELAGARSPDVDFEDAHLDERDQAGDIVDRQMIFGCAFLGDVHLPQMSRRAFAGMFLKETRLAAAGRAADDRQRTIDDVRQHPVGDLRIILGQIVLR